MIDERKKRSFIRILVSGKVTLLISNNVISKYPEALVSKNNYTVVWSYFLFSHFNSGYVKLLVSQGIFSQTRKFTLRYQYFAMKFDFVI